MKVALIGLTNFGKSTLFNRLTSQKLSSEYDGSHITNNYVEGTRDEIIYYDTPGITDKQQVLDFINQEGIDLVLFITKSTRELTQVERQILNRLGSMACEIWIILNFSDLKGSKNVIGYNLKEIIYMTALSKKHTEILHDKICALKSDQEYDENKENTGNIVLLGRPNSGKSTLMNRLLGYDRSLVGEYEGTTRSVISNKWDKIVIHDTPGITSGKKEFNFLLNKTREDFVSRKILGCIYMIDPTLGITKFDKKHIYEAMKNSKFLVLVINKIDRDYEEKNLRQVLKRMSISSPVLFISAKTGKGIKSLISTLKRLSNVNCDIKTGDLNKFLKGIRESESIQRPIRAIKYMTQISKYPIRIRVFSPTLPQAYIKFLQRRIVQHFNLYGHNITLIFK